MRGSGARRRAGVASGLCETRSASLEWEHMGRHDFDRRLRRQVATLQARRSSRVLHTQPWSSSGSSGLFHVAAPASSWAFSTWKLTPATDWSVLAVAEWQEVSISRNRSSQASADCVYQPREVWGVAAPAILGFDNAKRLDLNVTLNLRPFGFLTGRAPTRRMFCRHGRAPVPTDQARSGREQLDMAPGLAQGRDELVLPAHELRLRKA